MATTAAEAEAKRSVCVVGSGISGLASAWALAREGWQVTLLEAGERLGGHSLTFPGEGDRPDVDLGFQVFNFTTYPYLTQLFEELGVDHEPSDMSFALSVDSGRVEWASHGISTVFAQPGNAASPSFLRMMREVVRFGNEAPKVLAEGAAEADLTLGEYLERHGYSQRFCDEYLLPTTAAVWSVPNSQMLGFPVRPLVAFMHNHHLLNPLGDRPRWRVVRERSKAYVDAVAQELERMGATVRLSAPVGAVRQGANSVTVETADGAVAGEFDHVVLACHSDTAATMLQGEALAADRALVERIRYQPNKIFLHSDESQMPRARAAWASWNVLDKTAAPEEEEERNICVTYWLNHLQNLPESAPLLLCTLNPLNKLDPAKVIFETVLDHPIFDAPAMDAQRRINELQADATADSRRVWFAGAWLGSGFHEDGIRSAIAVATSLSADGKTPPDWARRAGAPERPCLELVRGPAPGKTWGQALGLRAFRSLAARGLLRGHLRMMLPNGEDLSFGRASPAEAREHGEPVVLMRVQDLAMLWHCVTESDIGLGHAYMHRLFEVDNLVGLFDVLILNNQSLRDALNPMGISADSPLMSLLSSAAYAAGNLIENARHLMRDNTVAGSRKNIEEHYDLGNGMYKLFLDKSMTYSCGIHTKACGAALEDPNAELPLYEAQLAKLDAIIKRAQLKPTDHVLEIGCGWGSFAIRAATTVGCRVTGITISTEQLAEARERVEAAGVADKVNLIICDYRKMGIEQYVGGKDNSFVYEQGLAPASFDKIVSIEMLEAVGHKHLPEYFETVERMLRPGGRAVIQVISILDERYKEYCATSDFIRRYIFPGGHLPCLSAVQWATKETALTLDEVVDIGPDYAITLRMWRERFLAKKSEILALGYPESWFRCFEMYFAYCESGFQNKYILDYHLTFINDVDAKRGGGGGGQDDGPAQDQAAGQVSFWLANFDAVVLPAVVAVMCWVSILSLTLNSTVRQLASMVCGAVVFSTLIAAYLPKLDPSTASATSRTARKSRMVFVKLCISALVCAVVVGLLAFHEVLYTTRLANNESRVVAATAADAINQSEFVPVERDEIHFCRWGGVADDATEACRVGGASAPLADGPQKYFVRSPMHFVVAVLAWAALSRFFLHKSFMNGLHAGALAALSLLSYSTDTRIATSALGLAIVHGVSELHACFACLRTLLFLRGYNMSSPTYVNVWRLDLALLFLIRWLPVPVLLSPVILKAPARVLVPICCIAVRETAVLIKTLMQLKEEHENRVNTDQLLSAARSRESLIKAMVGDDKAPAATEAIRPSASAPSAAPAPSDAEPSSAIFSGTVWHRRKAVAGASPSSHFFKYDVWMGLVDLAEVARGTAFQSSPLVSVGSRWNVFTWNRRDYYDPDGAGRPLDQCVRELVKQRAGLDLPGPVLMLTNLRCCGFLFNPVTIYYCLSEDRARLRAAVLEVSNTPWLEKRMYVVPLDKGDGPWFKSAKWKKDFHVSPFFDVFYNYQWSLTLPGDEVRAEAVSTRRARDAAEHAAREDQAWVHQTGDAPTREADESDDGPTTFVAGFRLKRATGSAWRELLRQPLMTFMVALNIHVQAGIIMIKKGCGYQDKPANARDIGLRDLASNLLIFAVAGVWQAATWPVRALARAIQH